MEVDITSIEASRDEKDLTMRVYLNSPLVTDYNFAVLLALFFGDNVSAYMWEIHDTANRIGQVDYSTGELIAEAGGPLLIEHDRTLGQVTFTIPLTATIFITNTTPITSTGTTNQFYVASFHTPQEGQPKYCDTAGPYDFSPEFQDGGG